MTITGDVKNLATVDATNLTLSIKGQPTGGAEQALDTETFSISAGGSHPFTVTTTAGSEGTVALTGTISQNSTTLAQIYDQYVVATPQVTVIMTAPDSAGNDPFIMSLQLTNSGKTDATITVGKSFNSLPETVTVPAGQTRLLLYSQQITADNMYTFTMTGDLNTTLTRMVSFVGSPSIIITTKVVTDKVSYNPNELATLISTVFGNTTMENLFAWISVTNSQGNLLFSDIASIRVLNQGQQILLSTVWDTGAKPPGVYLVALRILDSAGLEIGKNTCTLVINTNSKPTALLKGKISLDKQSILTGEPVAVTYSITDTGNVDIANVSLAIRTLNMAEQTIYNTISDQVTLPMGASYTNSGRIDTGNYGAKDYVVVLRATIAGVEETIASSYFRVEGAPSAPALSGPANGADVDTFIPLLTVSNAADPNDDRLTYEFEIYSDNGLMNLVISGTTLETSGITSWTVPAPLTENQTYYWRTRAFDGWLYGPWMAPASFRVNTVNDPPTAPTVSNPLDASSVASLTPVLTVNNASDPDSANLTYNFDLALDPAFTQIVATAKGIPGGQGATSWQVPVPLIENSWYYWRAQADDWLVEGPLTSTARFFVNTVNNAPTAPVITSPANGATVASLATDIIVFNSTDSDSATLAYFFEVDTLPTFDSANLIRSGSVAEQQGTTLWHVEGLKDNTQYYVRVRAGDGATDSPWSAVVGFLANAVNDSPTIPALANPSNGAGVNVLKPTLSIHNAMDPDRDVLTYDFELYGDAALTSLVTNATGIPETTQISSWTVPVALTENQTYYWRSRASDGSLLSAWMPAASFMVNAANDAPGAPQLSAPADGKSLGTLIPALTVVNAFDPDSATLTYDFEVYNNAVLVDSIIAVPEGVGGLTSATLKKTLADNTAYSWRARAFDGDRYGSWMNMATFTTHIAQATITTQIEFDPQTLNKKSNGTWVNVKIGLPRGYIASDIDISSIRLEGRVPAELRPTSIQSKDDGDTLMVKFRRSDVIAVLPTDYNVAVHVTGKVGTTLFEGVDFIRVIE